MRPIDADALESILGNAITIMKSMTVALDAEDDKEFQMEIKAYTDILNGVKEQPTIEPERKKGEWISKGYGEYRCSSCRNIVDLDEEILMSIKRFDYCPVCGAYMKEDTDDQS